MRVEKKRFGTVMSLILCVVMLCSCSNFSFDMFSPSKPTQDTGYSLPETSPTTETTSLSDLESDVLDPLTDEQAMQGFTNYLYFKIKNLQKILDEDKTPCTWGISSSDKKTIVIMFKSNTGALLRYYIDRKTGKTYTTMYVVETNSYIRTRETLNVREYIDRKPTPTPVVIKPSGKTTSTPTPKPKVKVTTAISKTSSFGGSKHAYKIPKVSISGKNTSSANNKMKKELSKFATSGAHAREITYTYHVTGKVVSILVHISNHDTDSYDNYKAYNISIKTGKLMSDKAVVKAAGSSTRRFFAKVKTTYKNFGGGSSAPSADAKKCRKKNLKRVSYKYIDPYIGKSGHLCFIGYVDFYGGSGSGRRIFDSVKKKSI